PPAPPAVRDRGGAGRCALRNAPDRLVRRVARVEVLRDDARLGDVELDRLAIGGADVDREGARGDEERGEGARERDGPSADGRGAYYGAGGPSASPSALATSAATSFSSPGAYPSRTAMM